MHVDQARRAAFGGVFVVDHFNRAIGFGSFAQFSFEFFLPVADTGISAKVANALNIFIAASFKTSSDNKFLRAIRARTWRFHVRNLSEVLL